MTPAIAFLRAVNVGGKGVVSMSRLADLFAGLELREPRPVLATGNIVFARDERTPHALEPLLETETTQQLGLATDFFVRDAAEWEAMIAANPFPEMAEKDPGHLLVVILKSAPAENAEARLIARISGRETVRLAGRHLFACYPDGIGRSKLSLPLIEKELGVRGTGRNWNTVLKIAAVAAGQGRR